MSYNSRSMILQLDLASVSESKNVTLLVEIKGDQGFYLMKEWNIVVVKWAPSQENQGSQEEVEDQEGAEDQDRGEGSFGDGGAGDGKGMEGLLEGDQENHIAGGNDGEIVLGATIDSISNIGDMKIGFNLTMFKMPPTQLHQLVIH